MLSSTSNLVICVAKVDICGFECIAPSIAIVCSSQWFHKFWTVTCDMHNTVDVIHLKQGCCLTGHHPDCRCGML